MLLDALQQMTDQHARALIAGSGDAGYEEHLHREVARRNLDDRVAFLGFVGGREKLSLYQAADIVVHPSAHESFGLALVEALACGTPVITTRAVNIWPELDGSGGAVISDQSSTALARAVEESLANGQRLVDMGRAGREWVFDHLDADRVSEQYEDLYRRAVGEHPGHGRSHP
jgi:glycosyltransferase involved in cell wall biosynthesis